MERQGLCLAAVVAILAASAASAQESLSARVEQNRLVLTSHGTEYRLFVSNDSLQMNVSGWSYPLRFSVAEAYQGAQDWLGVVWSRGEVVADTDTEKVATAVFTLFYRPTEDPKTRRGQAKAKGEPEPELKAQVEVTLRVRADAPGIWIEQSVVNNGEPFTCYCLPWFNAGVAFFVPGPEGILEKKFQGKYATVAEGTMPWLFLPPRDGTGGGIGLIFLEPDKVFVGEYGTAASPTGSIYLNARPRTQTLATGGRMTMRLRVLPANSAEEVQKAAS